MTVFSKIIKGEIPSYKIAEDSEFFAFLDINPKSAGHTLVVPKIEVDYFFDIEDKMLSTYMIFAKKVAKSIKSVVECNRVSVTVIGLDVPHAHIHLIPINDGFDFVNDKANLTKEEMESIAKKISDQFNK